MNLLIDLHIRESLARKVLVERRPVFAEAQVPDGLVDDQQLFKTDEKSVDDRGSTTSRRRHFLVDLDARPIRPLEDVLHALPLHLREVTPCQGSR
jgi:hypothetical protein